jgi:hypothetical protein
VLFNHDLDCQGGMVYEKGVLHFVPTEGKVFVDDLMTTPGPTLIVQENRYSPWELNLEALR